ncbi:MAG: hypothetical protein H3C50_00570 [Kiritimatiellae bacterium]|nr:hypothetical protein [Kiritimatiellia bacterium]
MRDLHRSWICLVALLAAMPAVAQQLANSGFEDNLNNWSTFGQGWRTGGGGDAHSGSLGAVNDVQTSDSDTYRGLFQNVPVIPDNLYSGGAYIRAVNVDNSESWFELQFLDSSGSVIVQHQSTHVATDQGFTFMDIDPVLAPAGAVTASVRAIVYMPSAPGDTDYHIFDDIEFTNATPVHSNLLNWGFETGDFADWSTFGQGWSVSTGDVAFSHTYGAVNDVLLSDGDEWRGVIQNVAVTEGLTYAAGVYIRAVALESSEAWLELQWLNSSGGVISQLTTSAITTDQAFQLASLHGIVAPAGAVTASVRGIVHMVSAPTVTPDFLIFDEFYFLRPVDLTITLSASTNIVGANQLITYSLLINNRSASMSGSYFVTNDFTTNLTFVSASDDGVNSGSTVSWSMFGLLGGATTTLTVTATQPHYTGSTQEYVHTVSASVGSGIGDPISGNNSQSTQTTTVGVPMLTLLALLILGAVFIWARWRMQRREAEA